MKSPSINGTNVENKPYQYQLTRISTTGGCSRAQIQRK